MKARVIVQLKREVLDPQGETIRRALNKMGHREISRVRQGKYFEIEFDDPGDEQAIRQHVDHIAREILSNPMIESFEVQEIS